MHCDKNKIDQYFAENTLKYILLKWYFPILVNIMQTML